MVIGDKCELKKSEQSIKFYEGNQKLYCLCRTFRIGMSKYFLIVQYVQEIL